MSIRKQPESISPEALLASRHAHLERLLGRRLEGEPPSCRLSAERRRFLREEGEDLYWNELAWSKLADDDCDMDVMPADYVFPGFLAFVEGLLRRTASGNSPEAPRAPRTEVVEDLLRFLALRRVRFREAGSDESQKDGEITSQLMDLVLCRYYDMSPEEIHELENAWLRGDR